MPTREILPSGQVRLSTGRCTFLYTRLRPDAVYLAISGYDKGELRSQVLEEIQADARRHGPIHVFIDARQVNGIGADASDLWTEWIRSSQDIQGIHVLVESKVVHMILAISKELTRRGNLMQVYSSPEAFRKAVLQVVPGLKHLPGELTEVA